MNNRQSGRRRGRGGQRPQSNGGNRDNGNRIDNRARGNAPQLLEKYKTLARDAQMQGDRVLTEYYLQFADHYFRVVAESRARFEENRPQRRDDWQDDDQQSGEGNDAEMGAEGEEADAQDNERPRRDNRRDRDEGPREGPREGSRESSREAPREAASRREPRRDRNRDDDASGNRGNRRPRGDDEIEGVGTDALPIDILPPAIGIAELPSFNADNDADVDIDADADVEAPAPAPRRRGRLGTRTAKAADTAEV